MLDRVWRELRYYRDLRHLVKDLNSLRGSVQRTPDSFERLFPDAVWGHPDRKNGPMLLTFDDGPDAEATPAILDVLKLHKVKAIFFLLGEKIEGNATLIKRMKREGHYVGYHGADHKAWWMLMRADRRIQMDPSLMPFKEKPAFTPDVPLLLRPPYGRFDFAACAMAEEMNARLVLWRLVVGDWKKVRSNEQLVKRLLDNTKPGDILVLHDGGENGKLLPRLLDTVIPLWKQSGLRLGVPSDFIPEVSV